MDRRGEKMNPSYFPDQGIIGLSSKIRTILANAYISACNGQIARED
jgi:hypothetical protein